MFLCIFVEAFYGLKWSCSLLKKRLIVFNFIFTVVLKQLAILPLRVYFIRNKINNHAV